MEEFGNQPGVPIAVGGDLHRRGAHGFPVHLHVGVNVRVPGVAAHDGDGELEGALGQIGNLLFQRKFHAVLFRAPEMGVFGAG